MSRFPIALIVLCASVTAAFDADSQSVVPVGQGSIASQPPNYGSVGDALKMLTRKIYCDEQPATIVDGLEVPGRVIPTNDWWTDVINNRYSGALWAYPAMVNTSVSGVEICYPSYWADYGKEVKSKSSVTVGGSGFRADATIAQDWGDWSVVVRMPQINGIGNMDVTLAHGMPFTWFEFNNISPTLKFNIRGVDQNATTAYPPSTVPVAFATTAKGVGIKFGDDLYGFYFPAGATCRIDDKGITFDSEIDWLVVALLSDERDFAEYDKYAVCVPRNTAVSWNYDEARAVLSTDWDVDAENLRGDGDINILQGFLPHVYKHALAGAQLSFNGKSYLTPRGQLRMAASANGHFGYSYQFNGMLPAYAEPHAGNSARNGFDRHVLDALMLRYADEGTFGGDTYWGGKGLTQMALNMMFAKQTGNNEVYELSKRRLREIFENWLTYKPGENSYYLSYFKRWGGILGIDVSYGSDTFNDHHFHYGYFTYAAALLCMEDKEFARKYGDVLVLLAKDYANWDRSDKRFPFMRTLDPFCGHSWAGGLGDGGNDNGNGQESTSESMQGWGGIYLLGVALDNKEMRDAGLFGWATEARATREYWFDPDQPRASNKGGREAWPGKNGGNGTYDYNLYPYAYNSNITGKGIGWWTWFGGDPLFMHGIQWMPISPALDYLSWDADFVKWAYNDMMAGANSAYSHHWFETTYNSDNGEAIQPLAHNDWGNVTLAYLQRADPELAAEIFAKAYDQKLHIANSVSTAHISYFTTHHTLTYGLPDTRYHANIPTAAVFTKDGVQTYMAYNPGDEDVTVTFYDNTGKAVKTVVAAPGLLTAFDKGEPKATSIKVDADDYVAPGKSASVLSKVLDQYGATLKNEKVTYTVSPAGAASVSGNRLTVAANVARNTIITVTAKCGEASESFRITANDKPEPQSSFITGIEENDDELAIVELGTALEMQLHFVDQYGADNVVDDAVWTYQTSAGDSGMAGASFTPSKPGVYTICAVSRDGRTKAEERVFVTPLLPSISEGVSAVSSSEENAGSLTKSANDGDMSTRWGSKHTDNEWIYLDLGEDKFISRVGINWEAAYASKYEIQVAPSGCVMTTHNGEYTSGKHMVELPADDAWTVSVMQQNGGLTGANTVFTRVNATGRYVRMKGIERGSAYGYSLYEFTVYGLDGNIGPDDLLGIDFSMPEAIGEGETITITPICYSRSGGIIQNAVLTWSADKKARFEGNRFTPEEHGLFKLTASTPDGKKAEGTIFVYECSRLKELTLTGTEFEMLAGERVVIDYSGIDQFDAVYMISDDDVEVSIYDEKYNKVSTASYSVASRTFRSEQPGVYLVVFKIGNVSNTAVVRVHSFDEANLALAKAATSSGDAESNFASYVNDGRPDTRWGSVWEDNQWVMIDLENAFCLNRATLVWEAAYAKKYRLQTSLDGLEWTTVYTQTNSAGGTENISFDETPARYIRMYADERALTAYGVSLYEFEVYGTGRYQYDDGRGPEYSKFEVVAGDGTIDVTVAGTDQSGLFDVEIQLLDDNESVIDSHSAVGVENGEILAKRFENVRQGNYVVKVTGTDEFNNSSSLSRKIYVSSTSLIEVPVEPMEERWYDLNGFRVLNPRSGIFIRVIGNRARKIQLP